MQFRTNRISIKGDTGTRKRIRNMIEMLDVPSADRLGGLKVFKLNMPVQRIYLKFYKA